MRLRAHYAKFKLNALYHHLEGNEMASWEPISLGSRLRGSPTSPVVTVTHGKLNELPFNELNWEDFERLQLRVLEEVEGLTKAYRYGDAGQAQYGIDIIGFDAHEDGVALQSKKYKKFTAGDLKKAVSKFLSTNRPFQVKRLIIGVASPVNSTQVINELLAQEKLLQPLVLELWDAVRLSALLKDQPRIVIDFFGEATAQAFCHPYEIEVLQVPSPDVVAVQEAIIQSPEVATGAQFDLDEASNNEDPNSALALIESAQKKLRQAGFALHAQQYDERRLELSAQVGKPSEAARNILDRFWEAIEHGQSSAAQQKQMVLQEFVRHPAAENIISEYQRVINVALDLYENPLGNVPPDVDLCVGDVKDQAHLFILAGETALANHQQDWLVRAHQSMEELSVSPVVSKLQKIRLRLLMAEATAEWTTLYGEASRSALGNGMGALVTARYARVNALNQRFKEADALWSAASGLAALARQWELASTCVLSQRMFRSRWKPFSGNELLPLQLSLKKMGTSQPLIPLSSSAYENAMLALRRDKLRPAAISAQKSLRDAILIGDWFGENRSRELLGEILARAEEPELAARQFIHCGAVNQAVALAQENAHTFIDLTSELDAPNYWTVGTLYRFLSVQADLIPDDLVCGLASRMIKEIVSAENRNISDQKLSNTSRYRNAYRLLAGIANRISYRQADEILEYLEQQPQLSKHQYRLHDEEEALIVAHIVLSHPTLAKRGVEYLTELLDRSVGNEKELPLMALNRYEEFSQPLLVKLAEEGRRWAQELLARWDLLDSPQISEDALKKLNAPLSNTPGQYVSGTSAVSDSLLVHNPNAKEVASTIRILLNKADDPKVSSLDRGEYLIAASNLVEHIPASIRTGFFEQALRLAYSPAPSEYDQITAPYTHKLSFFRSIGEPRSARTKALLLAAKLATNEDQRQQVQNLIYRSLTEGSDHWLARALQILRNIPESDIPFLASQGWEVRVVAAQLWGRLGGSPHLGERLARDTDVRVRRSLASAISQQHSDHYAQARAMLEKDPAFSVRSRLQS